jgi:hypothetical protein
MTDRLRIVLLFAVPLLGAGRCCGGLIGTYVFDGDTLAPSGVAANVTLSDFGYSGSATPEFTAGGAFSASGWPTNGVRDDNFNFSITVDSGFLLNLESIMFDERRSLTGPVAAAVTIDGSDLELFSMPDDDQTRTQIADQNSASFSALTGTVMVRFYATGAESGGGTWRLDNVQLNGTVSAIPEPSACLLVGTVLSGVASAGLVRKILVGGRETS